MALSVKPHTDPPADPHTDPPTDPPAGRGTDPDPAPETQRRGAPKRRGGGGRPRVAGLADAILNATVELAAERELDEFTLEDIAARAGVGRATIYRRWPSKEALLHEAMARTLDRHWTFDELYDERPVRERLVQFARINIEQLQSPLRSLWSAYFHLERSHLADDIVKDARDRAEAIVRLGIERGELRPHTDPELLLELIFGAIWVRATTSRPIDVTWAETLVDAVLQSWSSGT